MKKLKIKVIFNSTNVPQCGCGAFANKGMLKMRKALAYISVILFMLCLIGCSKGYLVSSYDVPYDEIYSRKEIYSLASSASYGYGRDDDLTTALVYMYSNKEFRELYGEDFEFTPDDIICYGSEGEARFFLWNFKGVAEYSFKINDVKYIVKLKKDYKTKWKVTDCYLEEQDDSNSGDNSLS